MNYSFYQPEGNPETAEYHRVCIIKALEADLKETARRAERELWKAAVKEAFHYLKWRTYPILFLLGVLVGVLLGWCFG